MQLWEEDLLELDDPVNDYLPFEVIHPDFPDTDITFRMLMSHVGGVRDNWTIISALMTFGYDTPVSLSDFCYRYFSEEWSYYNPDKSFNNAVGVFKLRRYLAWLSNRINLRAGLCRIHKREYPGAIRDG